jgi:hypothetical protein
MMRINTIQKIQNSMKKKTRCGRFAHLVPLAPRDTWELEYISLRIPVEIINSAGEGKAGAMHRECLREILELSNGDISAYAIAA